MPPHIVSDERLHSNTFLQFYVKRQDPKKTQELTLGKNFVKTKKKSDLILIELVMSSVQI